MFVACRTACSEDERALFSEDDMMSDSGGSSLPSRKNSLEQVSMALYIYFFCPLVVSFLIFISRVIRRVLTKTWLYLPKRYGITLL